MIVLSMACVPERGSAFVIPHGLASTAGLCRLHRPQTVKISHAYSSYTVPCCVVLCCVVLCCVVLCCVVLCCVVMCCVVFCCHVEIFRLGFSVIYLKNNTGNTVQEPPVLQWHTNHCVVTMETTTAHTGMRPIKYASSRPHSPLTARHAS